MQITYVITHVTNRDLRFAAYLSDMNKELITAYKVAHMHMISIANAVPYRLLTFLKNL